MRNSRIDEAASKQDEPVDIEKEEVLFNSKPYFEKGI